VTEQKFHDASAVIGGRLFRHILLVKDKPVGRVIRVSGTEVASPKSVSRDSGNRLSEKDTRLEVKLEHAAISFDRDALQRCGSTNPIGADQQRGAGK
jgi:hypothetical protein